MTLIKRRLWLFPIVVLVLSLIFFSSPIVAQEDLPAAPVLSAKAENDTIIVSWNAVSGAVSYDLRVWWNPLPTWQDLVSVSGTSYTHEGLVKGRKYWYTARSINQAGQKSAWQQTFASVVAEEGSATESTATPVPTPTQAAGSGNGPTPSPTDTPAPTSTPLPTPTPTQETEWCRVAQENTIQGRTLDKFRTLFPGAQAPSLPNITEVWTNGNLTAVFYELAGFYRHSDGRAGEILGVEYYSVCTFVESRIWFVPFPWHGGDIIILLRHNQDHNDQP